MINLVETVLAPLAATADLHGLPFVISAAADT